MKLFDYNLQLKIFLIFFTLIKVLLIFYKENSIFYCLQGTIFPNHQYYNNTETTEFCNSRQNQKQRPLHVPLKPALSRLSRTARWVHPFFFASSFHRYTSCQNFFPPSSLPLTPFISYFYAFKSLFPRRPAPPSDSLYFPQFFLSRACGKLASWNMWTRARVLGA